MLIEFNGLPGSGKTTITHEIIDLLSNNGYQAIDLQQTIREVSKKRFKVFLITLLGLFRGGIKLFFLYRKCLRLVKNKAKGSSKIIFNSLKNYSICIHLFRKSKEHLIVSDQFIIQSIVSLFYTSMPNRTEAIQSIVDYEEKCFCSCIFVDVKIDFCGAAERIKQRKTDGGRFDKLNEQELLDTIEKQKGLFELIRNNIQRENCITVDSSFPARDNALLILEYLEAISTLEHKNNEK